MSENEVWRPIPEFMIYEVSDQGRVRHQGRDNVKKITVNQKGFPLVVLFRADASTRYVRHVNQLVAEAFLPLSEDPDATNIWHIDGDLENCRADNLKWETRRKVLEWNEMHRNPVPKYKTPKVQDTRTGEIYANAFWAGMMTGRTENNIMWWIESYTDEDAPFVFLWEN